MSTVEKRRLKALSPTGIDQITVKLKNTGNIKIRTSDDYWKDSMIIPCEHIPQLIEVLQGMLPDALSLRKEWLDANRSTWRVDYPNLAETLDVVP